MTGQRHALSATLADASFRPLVAGIASLIVAMGVGRFAYTALLPDMQHSTGFSNVAAAVLASSNYAGYLAGALATATLPSAMPRATGVRVLLIASIATTAAMALTTDLTAWNLLRFASGAISAGILVLGSDLVLRVLQRHGHQDWIGVHFAGVGLGIALTGLAVAILGGSLDWRAGWIGLAAVCGLLLPLCWVWLPPDSTQRRAAPAGTSRSDRFPLSALIAAYFCEGAGYIVTGTFLVAIVKTTPNLEALAAYAWVMVGIAAAPSAVLWGRIAVRMGAPATLVLAHLIQAVGIVLPIWFHSALAVLLAAALFGGTFMGITVVAVSFAGRLAANSGRAIGLVTAGFGLGQILGPLVAGSLAAEGHGFKTALIAASATVVVGALLILGGRWYAALRTIAPPPARESR